ncbi:Fpg/Nei family DNA glycosylase [Paenibacillus psychroresistens]|uniref:Fpg/Nei family DNA glycosylase n=1 Tax=Paenibacillus psychroresistens TaxID=1778678 RepID=A0A6B8RLQ9_9BACL|nr:DNA-formamidopyrimidine glycosylase family protein [Paenibacillus psychroresistens]QGQ96366.1 Fpg/Nei family DNA glycosylase [Paenibacillus psychroresistens]
MPELPEMENYKRLLSSLIVNKPIIDLTVTREKTINIVVDEFRKKVLQHSIVSIERRAKHLLFILDTGSVLLLHLMLGGSLYYGKQAPERTAQVILHFRDEASLYFLGLRLGYLHLHTVQEVEQLLIKLGPEPLDNQFSFADFQQVLRGRRTNLKVMLVDQSVMSGIGNCYSDEICFIAELLPTRKVNALTEQEQKQLYQAMQTVLKEAIYFGGYMDTPLYEGDRLTGQFDPKCRVYDREGEPCLRCGYPLIKDEVSSKKCFYCRHCQK